MTLNNNFLFDPSWQCFIKMRLIFLLGILSLIFLYYQLLSASLSNLLTHLPIFGLLIWSFNGQMNEIILISLLISIITFFVYYICSIQCLNSKLTRFYIIFSFFILFSIFTFIFFPVSNFLMVGYTLLSLSILDFLSIFLFFGGVNLYFMYIGLIASFKNQKNPVSLNELIDNHHAIIVINYQGLKLPVYGQGIDILIKSFKEKNYSYNVYFCNDETSIITSICNNKAVYLWIFGHGKKDALKLPNHEFLYYHEIDFTNVQKKYFVGQFHCNPCIKECERSLAELIGIYGYVSNDYRDTLKNRKEIQTLQQISKY